MKVKKILFYMISIISIILSIGVGYLLNNYIYDDSNNPSFFNYSYVINLSNVIDTSLSQNIEKSIFNIYIFDEKNFLITTLEIIQFENEEMLGKYMEEKEIKEESNMAIFQKKYKNCLIKKVNIDYLYKEQELYPTLEEFDKENSIIIK